MKPTLGLIFSILFLRFNNHESSTKLFVCRRRRERQVDDRETDEDHPRDRLQSRGMPTLPARRLLQHNPVPPGDHLGDEQTQDRFRREAAAGELVTRSATISSSRSMSTDWIFFA